MAVSSERFRQGDVFVDYPFEQVMFRWEMDSRTFFRKFYGETSEGAVPHDNELLNDAIRSGEETDQHTYRAGRPARWPLKDG